MAANVDVKSVLKHLIHGSLEQFYCRICLLPVEEGYENIFTKVCKEDKEYSIADVLDQVCNLQIDELDKYLVCSDCFVQASSAYKFYLQCTRSTEILLNLTSYLESMVDTVENQIQSEDSASFYMPQDVAKTEAFDYDISEFSTDVCQEIETTDNESYASSEETDSKSLDESIIVLYEEDGKRQYYKMDKHKNIVPVNIENTDKHTEKPIKNTETDSQSKKRTYPKGTKRKREPMPFKDCPYCPLKFKFVSKLKTHLQSSHKMEAYYCKVCDTIMEDDTKYQQHMQMHTDVYTCATCGVVFKRRDTMVAHVKQHEDGSNDRLHICEICGQVMANNEELKGHYEKRHATKFTCYYCGKCYKGEVAFAQHIRKHENENSGDKEYQCPACPLRFASATHLERHVDESPAHDAAKPFVCTCGEKFRKHSSLVSHQKTHGNKHCCDVCKRSFVDSRALLWHQRLHTNERPYVCDRCGKGFVSLNRRNQHALCAHSEPTKRCPLCPALFHLASMVTSHIKRVHLKSHKRSRNVKYRDVKYNTQRVQIQDLSISIQSDVMEMQANDSMDFGDEYDE